MSKESSFLHNSHFPSDIIAAGPPVFSGLQFHARKAHRFKLAGRPSVYAISVTWTPFDCPHLIGAYGTQVDTGDLDQVKQVGFAIVDN